MPRFYEGDVVQVVEISPTGPFAGTGIRVGDKATVVECERGKVIVAKRKNGDPMYFFQNDSDVELLRKKRKL